MHLLIVFRNGGGLLFMSFLHNYVDNRVYNLHNPHNTGHIENHKEHTAVKAI